MVQSIHIGISNTYVIGKMGPKKGSGPSKGKAPAKKRPIPHVSPQQSSDDEESLPIWKKLQDKILALEAQRSGKIGSEHGVAPRRSNRNTEGRRKANLAALAQNLIQRCDALESIQVPEGNVQDAEEGPSSAIKMPSRAKRGRMVAPEARSSQSELQPVGINSEETGASFLRTGDATNVAGMAAGESASAVDSQPSHAVWPWAITAQSQVPPTSYNTQPLGWPNICWPSPTQQFCGWSTPAAAPVTPGTSGVEQGKNIGQHPSVPNTGYNTVPITAMP